MEARPLKYFAEAASGNLVQGEPGMPVLRICTDSRHAQPGDLFVALKGDRFDGHAFIEETVRKGAVAVMTQTRKAVVPTGCAHIRVKDARRALGNMGARYRQDFHIPVIAVGGSNGKTTAKDLVASVLSQRYRTLKSEASFNNDIGVPVTLLNLEDRHQAAVLEVGTNHPGEVAALVRLVKPQLGIITSIGREHLEFFHDLAGVAAEEGWLAELLPANGTLFINRDAPETETILKRARALVVRVGSGLGNDWRVADIQLGVGGTTFVVSAPRPELTGSYRISMPGKHHAINGLLAITIGAHFGLTRSEIQKGLEECPPSKMRSQMWTANGIQVLDDAYNANADSMRAALQTLRELPCAGRRAAVLGDMAELGQQSESAHEEAGRLAAELGIDALFCLGKAARIIGKAARAAGMTEVREFVSVEKAASAIRGFLKPNDLVLLKASRAARFERIGELLRQNQPTTGSEPSQAMTST